MIMMQLINRGHSNISPTAPRSIRSGAIWGRLTSHRPPMCQKQGQRSQSFGCLSGFLLLAFCGSILGGCSTQSVSGQRPDRVDQAGPPPLTSQDADQRLTELIDTRNRESVDKYSIGPGDLFQVSVPDVPELRDQTVRVATDGSISLPLAGTLMAAGLSEEELRTAVRERL